MTFLPSFTDASPTLYSISNINATEILAHDFAFITAISSNHMAEGLGYIQSVQQTYACMPMYVYDLGLTQAEISFFEKLPFVKVLPFDNQGRPLFIRGANAFKGPLIANFIELYGTVHFYRFFFYGDSTTYMRSKFDEDAFREVLRHGILAELPIRETQIAYTHPKMYPYFNVDREREYKEVVAGNPLKQVQSGLMMIDCLNQTITNNFIKRWVSCCNNLDCLAPDGAITHKRVPPLSSDPNMTLADGTRVYRLVPFDQLRPHLL